MNDMQAVREAAERCEGLFECDIVDIENMSVECVTDLLTLARDRHRLTAPTPLTEEWIKKTLPPTGSPSPGSHESANYSTAIGKMSWIRWESGLCLYFFGEGVYWRNMTRGQFRMMAMSIGLELREDEG